MVSLCVSFFCFFKQKTAYEMRISDWSSDLCSSDLPCAQDSLAELRALAARCTADVPASLPPALACLVGYFGYETIGLVENLPRAQIGRASCRERVCQYV